MPDLWNQNKAKQDQSNAIRCVAITARGEQCRVNAMPNGERCSFHADTSEQPAEQRIKTLANAALEALTEAMNQSLALFDYKTALQCSTAILDRAGVGPQQKIQLDRPDQGFAHLSDDDLAHELESTAAELRHRKSQRMNETIMTDSRVGHSRTH